MATPGNTSEMSDRARAKAPTTPVASAANRSIRVGLTRLATWLLGKLRSTGS